MIGDGGCCCAGGDSLETDPDRAGPVQQVMATSSGKARIAASMSAKVTSRWIVNVNRVGWLRSLA